jgi:hypothetical protein
MARFRGLLLLAFLGSAAVACGGDDGDPVPIDAAGAVDGPPACVLESAIVTCTIGDDSPCTAVCGNAYCYTFNQVGTLCTQPCTPGNNAECPSGWTCNNMGRCRPP